MCFEYSALPPDPPPELIPTWDARSAGGGVASSQRITLTSQDGTQFSVFVARPATPSGAGIVILPDVRGLFTFYEELASRFAAAGVEAVAIDYFGRTAGLAPRDQSFDYMPHVGQTRPDQIAQDVSAAVAHLRQTGGANARAIFTVGFCFGGANSFHQAANHHGLAGVIGFYGNPTAARFGPPVIDRVGDFECPVLGLFGGADQGIPATEIEKFDAALTEAKIEHELITYPDAPHSFFDRTYERYHEESADAWRRMLAFIDAHTPKAAI